MYKNNVVSKILNQNKDYIKIILLLSIPVIIENILQISLGTADAYFVSKLDSTAISAIGATNLIMNIYIAFFTAIGVGTTATVSRYYGMNDFIKTNMAIKHSFIFSIILSSFIGFISYFFSEEIFSFLGLEDEVLVYLIPYFNAVAVPCVFLSLIIVLSNSLRAMGDTKRPMLAVGFSSILNILLDYLLIFGFWKFKGLGMLGAGIATTSSRVIAVIILLFFLNNKNKSNRIIWFKNWKIDKSMFISISKIGMPAGIEKLFMRSGQLVYNSIIISLGTASYVSHNIAGTIESYTYLPAMGFSIAAANLIGQSLGAKKPNLAKKYGYISYALSAILMSIMGVVIFIFAPFLVKIFSTETDIVKISTRILMITAAIQPFLAMNMVFTSSLQGAGDTKFPMYLTFFGIWVFRVGLGYILGIVLNLGLFGIWLAMGLDISIRGIILVLRFKKDKWKKIKI